MWPSLEYDCDDNHAAQSEWMYYFGICIIDLNSIKLLMSVFARSLELEIDLIFDWYYYKFDDAMWASWYGVLRKGSYLGDLSIFMSKNNVIWVQTRPLISIRLSYMLIRTSYITCFNSTCCCCCCCHCHEDTFSGSQWLIMVDC